MSLNRLHTSRVLSLSSPSQLPLGNLREQVGTGRHLICHLWSICCPQNSCCGVKMSPLPPGVMDQRRAELRAFVSEFQSWNSWSIHKGLLFWFPEATMILVSIRGQKHNSMNCQSTVHYVSNAGMNMEKEWWRPGMIMLVFHCSLVRSCFL